MHYSTSRVTGYPPHFLDLAICMQQILHRDKKLVLAMEEQKCMCQQAVDDFNHKHEKYLTSSDFVLETWVLLHEMWLDCQMGHKGASRWIVIGMGNPGVSSR